MTATVWVTRPASAGLALADTFSAAGIECHVEALIDILPLQTDAAWQRYHQAMSRFEAIDTCIFISANAVEQWLAAASTSHVTAIKHKTVFAVGKATQSALAAAGIASEAPRHNASSEALLELASLQHMQDRQVFIFRGIGGRGYLLQQLEQRGATAEHIEIYQRQSPEQLSSVALNLINNNGFAAVLIGSMETFENLLSLVPNWPLQIPLVVPSERVKQGLSELGYHHCVLSPTAMNSDMVATTQAILLKHRTTGALGESFR